MKESFFRSSPTRSYFKSLDKSSHRSCLNSIETPRWSENQLEDALDGIRTGFVCTVDDIARSHKKLQKRVDELDIYVETLQVEKAEEELHAQRLTELLARESKKNEETLKDLRQAREENQRLAVELSEVQNLYYRSTELAQMSQVDSFDSIYEPEEDHQQQDAFIQQLRLELSLKEPLVKQLQEQVEQLSLENERMRRRNSPPISDVDVDMESDGSSVKVRLLVS